MAIRISDSEVVPRYAEWAGPAVFKQGFRPFFLAAGVSAVVYVALWVAVLTGDITIRTVFPAIMWHAHEMLFGVIAAVIAGFLLTAIPNWTGRMPLQGWGLIGLFGLWFAGRVAVAHSATLGVLPAAVIDGTFLLALIAVALREIVAGRNWRNLPVVGAVGLLAVANGLSHAEVAGIAVPEQVGPHLGVAVIVMLISLVGGRIIPSFTGNWLAKNRPAVARPVPFNGFDRGVLLVTLLALAGWVALPNHAVTAYLLLGAGALHVVRIGRWRGLHCLRDPLVWSLHAGYLWVPVGLLLIGVTEFADDIPQTAGLHALTTGAMGGMVLAVMTRATLGHTGRALAADAATTAVYIFAFLAAAARVGAPFTGDYHLILSLSGGLWCAAFALFTIRYGAILCGK
ncbi:MAG: short-chain dehydrogenase [Rhodospirillaceae bacterium]|nr:short-chain dehydrogenase [Magnetovibrio sp.]MAY67337.1 short-chain dehydrogenase [Rhodospirillaceae bacterium]